jgi:hypothetical protein
MEKIGEQVVVAQILVGLFKRWNERGEDEEDADVVADEESGPEKDSVLTAVGREIGRSEVDEKGDGRKM